MMIYRQFCRPPSRK